LDHAPVVAGKHFGIGSTILRMMNLSPSLAARGDEVCNPGVSILARLYDDLVMPGLSGGHQPLQV
jgi:hypothetical protein